MNAGICRGPGGGHWRAAAVAARAGGAAGEPGAVHAAVLDVHPGRAARRW